MNQNGKLLYIFKKSTPIINLLECVEISFEAEIAAEIVATYEKTINDYRDYCVFDSDDPELIDILCWHETSETRFYSVVLTGEMCDLWYQEISHLFRGDGSVATSDLYDNVDFYLIDANKIIEEYGDRSMLNFIDIDLSNHLRSAFDQYLEECCNNIDDVFINAFNLKIYH